jgi:acyl carrier protein
MRWEREITSKGSTGGNRVPENQKSMTREEFLLEMDEILGLRAGTLRGDEKLEELENWDSTALISLIVLAETSNNAQISPDQVVGCSTVADLLRLAQVDGSSS